LREKFNEAGIRFVDREVVNLVAELAASAFQVIHDAS
jgi:hypothetical protein